MWGKNEARSEGERTKATRVGGNQERERERESVLHVSYTCMYIHKTICTYICRGGKCECRNGRWKG